MFLDLTYFFDRLQGSLFEIVSAAIIGLFGWYFAYTIGNKAASYLESSRFNAIVQKRRWNESLARIRKGLTVSNIFGKAIEIWILLFFLMVSAQILTLDQLSQLIRSTVGYFFNIFIAFIILAVAALSVDMLQNKIVAVLEREKFAYTRLSSKLISGTIWTLAVLAILYQLKITEPLVLAIFIGIVVTISVAIGVAIGLGGKDIAARILKEIEEKLK